MNPTILATALAATLSAAITLPTHVGAQAAPTDPPPGVVADSLRAELEELVARLTNANRELRREIDAVRRERLELLQEERTRILDELRELQDARLRRAPGFGGAAGRIGPMGGAPRGAVPGGLPPGFAPGARTAPLVLGQLVLAGATMTALNPSLARYFEVESGVLVTEVTPRSPAATAGMEPGDVIVEVGGVEVRSVPEARQAMLGTSGPPPRGVVPFTIVRGGERITLELGPEGGR